MREVATRHAMIRQNMSNVRRGALTFVNQLTECAPDDIRRSLVKGLSEDSQKRPSSWEVSGEQTGETPEYAKLAGRAGRVETRKTRQTDQRSSRLANCFSTLLEDRTALSLRCKPFSLQLF